MVKLKDWAPFVAAGVLLGLISLAAASPVKDPAGGPEFRYSAKIGPFLARSMPAAGIQGKTSYATRAVIHTLGSTATVETAVRDAGGTVEAVSGQLVQARLTVSQIQRLATHPAVRAMRVPYYAESKGFASVDATFASSLHGRGITGGGVRVAVLDIGFTGYRQRLGGELPAQVTVKNFNARGFETSAHGTAAAEIVHDMAPGAELVLVSMLTDVEFMAALDWIAGQQPEIQIINASIGFDNIGPLDATSPITQAADRMLEQHGILYVNAAGNEQQDYYSASFSDADGDGWHNFAGDDEHLAVQLNGAEPYQIILNWNDWGANPAQPAASRDYDIYLWCPGAADLTIENACASSTAPQTGAPFDRPLERINETAPQGGEYLLGIKRNSAGVNLLRLSFTGQANAGSLEYTTPSSTLTLPADGESVLAVGAFNVADYGNDLDKGARPTDFDFSINDWRLELPPEPYSSLGPTWDGRIKPELSAPDCVFTATFGPGGFCGTSAAAPHVAGAAALLLSEVPTRDARALRRILIASAEDVRPQGVDNAHGAGRLSLEAAYRKPRISARSGLWGNPAQSGHGFYFDVRADLITVLWYIYTVDGAPMWLLATGSLQNDRFSGPFYSYRVPENFGSPLADFFDGAGSTYNAEPVGTISVEFTGDATAHVGLDFSGDDLVAAADYQVDLNQFLTYPAASDSGLPYASPYTGLWYTPAQSGHGFFFLRQGFLPSPNLHRYPTDKLVVSWFGYTQAGEPLWLQGSGLMDDAQSYFEAGKNSGQRILYRFFGPTINGNFKLSQIFNHSGRGVGSSQTGNFTVNFQSANQAQLNFKAGGNINETLPVERLEF